MALFKKKAAPAVEEPMDLDAVMKKYDRESNTRVWEGTPRLVVNFLLALFSRSQQSDHRAACCDARPQNGLCLPEHAYHACYRHGTNHSQ